MGDFVSGRFIDEGVLAEQFVAQQLLRAARPGARPRLHFWLRGGRESNAEVDFLASVGGRVLPIEVKSGRSGTLRSLHQFMLAHQGETAIRLDLNPPSRQDVDTEVMTPSGKARVRYVLQSLPLYVAERIEELLE